MFVVKSPPTTDMEGHNPEHSLSTEASRDAATGSDGGSTSEVTEIDGKVYKLQVAQEPILRPYTFTPNSRHPQSLGLPEDPLPPLGKKAGVAREYPLFCNQVTQVHSALNSIRMNLRYHIRQPSLLQDLNISELRAQLDEIEARVSSKDTSEPHNNVRPLDSLPEPEAVIVDTLPFLVDFIDTAISAWRDASPSIPVLFLDSEGVNLGRHGSITLIQVYIPMKSAQVYLIDVQALGAGTFTTVGSKEALSFRDLLESPTLVKVWWDCRADADALYALHGIELAGVVDAQLVENATAERSKNQTTLRSLERAVKSRINIPEEAKAGFANVKGQGKTAMDKGLYFMLTGFETLQDQHARTKPTAEGDSRPAATTFDYDATPVMTQRPLHPTIIKYCVQDVAVLPLLLQRCTESKYWSPEWKKRVQLESSARLRLARSPDFDANWADMTVLPRDGLASHAGTRLTMTRRWRGE